MTIFLVLQVISAGELFAGQLVAYSSQPPQRQQAEIIVGGNDDRGE